MSERSQYQPGPATDHYHNELGVGATVPEDAASVAASIAAHEADTTAVHGISNTASLLTSAAAAAAYQPLDSDLTAIAALTTTSFGRGLLALADAAALGAAHSHTKTETKTIVVQGATGVKGDLRLPTCTIIGWEIVGDVSGTATVSFWKDTYANHPPVVGDLLFTATVSGGTKAQSGVLSHAITGGDAGDRLRVNLDTLTTATLASVHITYTTTV